MNPTMTTNAALLPRAYGKLFKGAANDPRFVSSRPVGETYTTLVHGGKKRKPPVTTMSEVTEVTETPLMERHEKKAEPPPRKTALPLLAEFNENAQ
jgi:hypothetical protein